MSEAGRREHGRKIAEGLKKKPAKMCVMECGGRARFFFLPHVGTVARSPQAHSYGASTGFCASCLNPKGSRWEDVKRKIAFLIWQTVGKLEKKLEDVDQAEKTSNVRKTCLVHDGKSAAAGDL